MTSSRADGRQRLDRIVGRDRLEGSLARLLTALEEPELELLEVEPAAYDAVISRVGLPRGTRAATANRSGTLSRSLTAGSWATAIVVIVPPKPSLRAASRMFHTSGYTEAPLMTPTRSRSWSIDATSPRSTQTTSTAAAVSSGLVNRNARCLGQNGRTIDGLLLGTTIDGIDLGEPIATEQAPHTAPATLGEGPVRNRDRRLNHDIRMGDEIDSA